jgi:hypothetical protein
MLLETTANDLAWRDDAWRCCCTQATGAPRIWTWGMENSFKD